MEPAERIEWHYHTGSQLVYPQRGVLQVFTEAFILAMRPAGSSCLAIRASDMLSRVLRLSLS